MIRIFENIDCMIGMERHRDLLTGRRTLAIVDPPYGDFDIIDRFNKGKYENRKPDDIYFAKLKELSRNQIVFGANHFNLPGGRIIWNKLGPDIGRRNQAPNLSDAEIAYQSFNYLTKIFSYTWIGNVVGNNYSINGIEFKERLHISQKPVALYRWLLQNYAKPGDLIVDTHVGSGSSFIACEIEGFEYLGFELDPDYYAAATERIKNHRKQPSLFEKKPAPVEREQLSLLRAE